MFGTIPHAVVLETRKFAKEREIEYTTVAKKRLIDFERVHKYALQYDDELKQKHRELHRCAAVARDAMEEAKRRARVATQNENYSELPLHGRIVGEMIRPLVIACNTEIAQAQWLLAILLIVPLVRIFQFAECLPLIPHDPSQAAFAMLSRIVYLAGKAGWQTQRLWEGSYLPAYYHRISTQDAHVFEKLADSFWITLIVATTVIESATSHLQFA